MTHPSKGVPVSRRRQFDLACPELGPYTKALCLYRQSIEGGCYQTRCAVGRELAGKKNEPIVKSDGGGDLCACGQTSMAPSERAQRKLARPLCHGCWGKQRDEKTLARLHARREEIDRKIAKIQGGK